MIIEKGIFSNRIARITLNNKKELYFMLDLCYTCLDYDLDENNHKLAKIILDKLADT